MNVAMREIHDRPFMDAVQETQEPEEVLLECCDLHDRPFIDASPPEKSIHQRDFLSPRDTTVDLLEDLSETRAKVEDDQDRQRHQFYSDQQALLASLGQQGDPGLSQIFAQEDPESYYVGQAKLLESLCQQTEYVAAPVVSRGTRPGKRRTTAASALGRTVRVFFSSTFKDMQEEREVLMKRVMPMLRAVASDRGVALSEVDLRWGISEEQSRSGATLNICLKEVDNCRPWFVGLLGERYGWSRRVGCDDPVLSKTFALAEANFPWISSFGDRSVTELEMRHAVLNDVQNVDHHAIFLLRDQGFSVGKGPDYSSEDKVSATRLSALKEEIRQSGAKTEQYSSPAEAGEIVRAHMLELLDRDFPAAKAPSQLEVERAAHETFARSRSRVYVGGETLVQRLLSHVLRQEDSPSPLPMVVAAESGLGKTSLLCEFSCRLQDTQPDRLVVSHFLGISAHGDLCALLRRAIAEIADHFDLGGLGEGAASDSRGLAETFAKSLREASVRGGLVLVLDALDQLDPADNSHELNWLPVVFPPRVLVFCSALTGSRPHEILTKDRKLPTLVVEPLDETSKRQLVESWMSQCTKSLSSAQVSSLVDSEACSNPLFLRTLLEDLRVFGSFERLGQRISECLACGSVPGLLSLVLDRVVSDTSSELPGCAMKLLGLVAVTHTGLREEEAMAILNLPQVSFCSLLIALTPDLLISRGGLLVWSHDFVRRAAEQKLPRDLSSLRSEVISFLGDPHCTSSRQRVCQELPLALLQAGLHDDLAAFIASPPNFLILCEARHRFELIRYFRSCQEAGCHPETVLLGEFNEKSSVEDEATLIKCGKFLQEVACFAAAESVFRKLLDLARGARLGALSPTREQDLALADAEDSLGYLYRIQGRFDEATPCYEEALQLRTKHCGEESPETAASMCSLAILYRKRGLYDRAEPLYLKSCDIRERILGLDHPDTAQSHNGAGCFYQDTGKDQLSESHFITALRIRERCYGRCHPEVAATCVNLGTLYLSQSRLAESERMCRRAADITREVYGEDHQEYAQAISYLASVHVEKGEYAQARPLYVRAIAIRTKLLGPKHPEVADSLTDFGVLCSRETKYDEALGLYERCLAIRLEVLGELHPDTAQAMNNVAALLMDRGEHEKAEEMYLEALSITERKFGTEHVNVCQSLLKLANLYQRQKKPFQVISTLYERTLSIFHKVYGHNHPDVALTLNDYAVLCFRNGDVKAAEDKYLLMVAALEAVYAKVPHHPDLLRAYRNVATFYEAAGRMADSFDWDRKAKQLC